MLQIPGNSYQNVKVQVLFFFNPLSFSLRERKQRTNLSSSWNPFFLPMPCWKQRAAKWLLTFRLRSVLHS